MIAQLARRTGAEPHECFFWALHSGAELDLLVVRGRQRRGFEVKLTDSPTVTPSMRSALESLKLTSLDVVHAGADTFQLGAGVQGRGRREDLVRTSSTRGCSAVRRKVPTPCREEDGAGQTGAEPVW